MPFKPFLYQPTVDHKKPVSSKDLHILQNYRFSSHLHELIEVKASIVQARCRKKDTMTDAAAAEAAASKKR